MLQVIQRESKFEPDGSRGAVVIESTLGGPPFNAAHDELASKEATALAQQFAATQGCTPAYLNGNKIGPYPVNAEGLSLEHVRDAKGNSLPPTHERMQPHRYRVDVPVCRPL